MKIVLLYIISLLLITIKSTKTKTSQNKDSSNLFGRFLNKNKNLNKIKLKENFNLVTSEYLTNKNQLLPQLNTNYTLSNSNSNNININNKSPIKSNIIYKGITFVGDRYCHEVDYSSPLAKESLINLALTGANSVAIVVTEYQDYANSTNGIYPIYENFPKDDYYTFKTEKIESIKTLIEHAKDLNLQVVLKPHIDVRKENNFNIWRGMIGETFNEQDWTNWFIGYEKFTLKYAKLAQETNVEMFSVSTELIQASKQEKHWRNLVPKIRNIYKGKLVDSANWGGEEVTKQWWDLVDFIGVDAYYIPMRTENNTHNYMTIEHDLDETLVKLENLSKKFNNKKIIITEIGFCSGNCRRNETVTSYDHYLQAYYYEKLYNIFSSKDFIIGFYWWSWNSDPNFGGFDDQCISPQHKIAELALRKMYGGDQSTINFFPKKKPLCNCTV